MEPTIIQIKYFSAVSTFCWNYMNKIFNAWNVNNNFQFVFITQIPRIYCAVRN
jgi:hypothetical protein